MTTTPTETVTLPTSAEATPGGSGRIQRPAVGSPELARGVFFAVPTDEEINMRAVRWLFRQDVWKPYRVNALQRVGQEWVTGEGRGGEERMGRGLGCSTKILDCQTEDFSSSVVLSAAVWKKTPQQAGPGPHPFSKRVQRGLGGQSWARTHSPWFLSFVRG